jgi:long-chain acyl-CoA synthetase
MNFLHALDLPVLEVYGQTETIVTSVNTPDAFRRGTVGRPVPGVSTRFAPDGELEVGADHFFRGYWQNDQETRESFTDDGWFKTGDFARVDPEGFLSITGRKKALLITAGGKNIAPEPLEDELSAIPGIAQAIVVGDRRRYLVALLTLDVEEAVQLASADLPNNANPEVIAKDANVLKAVQAAIDAVNRQRASFEQIKRFCLLPHPFSTEADELTPTLKVRRKAVEHHYAKQIEALYARSPSP